MAAFVILIVGCWMVPGGSDDFRMDTHLGRAILNGESPHEPATAYGGTADVTAFRTPIALLLTVPFGLLPSTAMYAISALFVAVSGLAFLWALQRPWWWAGVCRVDAADARHVGVSGRGVVGVKPGRHLQP